MVTGAGAYEFECPRCRSENLTGEADPDDSGVRVLTCGDCGHAWRRHTNEVCDKCFQSNFTVTESDHTRSTTSGPEYYSVEEYRCLVCNNRWSYEGLYETDESVNEFLDWTPKALETQARRWGIDPAGLSHEDLARRLQSAEDDPWTRELLEKLTLADLRVAAADYELPTAGRSRADLITAILIAQADYE